MIQDIMGFNPTYINKKPKANDYVLVYSNRKVLYNNRLPIFSEINNDNVVYGFSIDDSDYYILKEESNLADTSIDIMRSMDDRKNAFAIATGYGLYLWYKDKNYCPKCGKPISHSETERALLCDCGYIEYPRISPAVIVGVIHDNKILLTKYKEGYKNLALVAGYCEAGESFEDTVKREVLEEVGLRVKNIKYYKSQPWGMSASILAGYYCEVDGDPTVNVDGVELGFAKFFSKEEIDLPNDRTTLTRDMILTFKEQ